jgi:WD40 repeat protein/energy-coupling factor transporter ATP-binding protein EcfA2
MSTPPEYSFDLFISHAQDDAAWVRGYLIPALGLDAGRVITPEGFRPGAPQPAEFERAVKESRYTVLVFSPSYLADAWGRFSEQLVTYASVAGQRERLVPVLLRPCTLPLGVEFRVRLDYTDEEGWGRETDRLRELFSLPEPGEVPLECPYPGMVPFGTEDAPHFFGRDKEVDDLDRRLRNQNYLFVIGPSGSGKSSLVFAGLIPRLKKQAGKWSVRVMRPGDRPRAALAQALGAEAAPGGPDAQPAARAPRPLLIIDQFEELFTQAPRPEQSGFIADLKSLRREGRCALLMTMRADFYPDLMNSDLWPVDGTERVEIAPLRGDALRDAIAKPAARLDVHLEAGLLERIMSDAADEPGVLPLVQETMALLWEKREQRLLTLRAYGEMGDGGLSGLAVAVAAKADATVAALEEPQRLVARRIFLRLIQFGEGRADTRRRQTVAQLKSADKDPLLFDQVLRHLADNRLLTLSGDGGGKNVDIAHETLIGGWPTLREWLGARREAEQTRRRLESKASEWVRLGRAGGGLLDEVELLEAERWLESGDAAELSYDEALPAVVAASRAALSALEREREEARRRELAQVQALAEEQKRRADAEVQRRIESESRQLAAQSISLLPNAYDLALLLSVEANRAFDTFEARSALYTALQHNPPLKLFLRGLVEKRIPLVKARRKPGLVFGPGGETLFTVGGFYSDAVVVWDLHTCRPRATLSSGDGILVYAVACSHDGRTVAAGREDGTIILWDVAAGVPLGPPLVHSAGDGRDGINTLSFSPAEGLLASGAYGDNVALWDAATGKLLNRLTLSDIYMVNDLSFGPTGRLLSAFGFCSSQERWNEELTFVFDLATGERTGPLAGRGYAFSPGGETLALAGLDDEGVTLWDVNTRSATAKLDIATPEFIGCLSFSPDGKTLAVGREHSLIMWDVENNRPLKEPFNGHVHYVDTVAFGPDGSTVASMGLDDAVILWSAAEPRSLGRLFARASASALIRFSHDGQYLVSAAGGEAGLWEVATARPVRQFVLDAEIRDFDISPRGLTLAVLTEGQAFYLIDASADATRPETPARFSDATKVAFSPDGATLAFGWGDGSVVLWEPATQRQREALAAGSAGPVTALAFSPDGGLLAVGHEDGAGHVCRVAGDEPAERFAQLVYDELLGLSFHPDGGMLLGTGRERLYLWNVETRKLINHYSTGSSLGSQMHAAFSPDGSMLAWATHSRPISLMDARARQRFGPPLVYEGNEGIRSFGFSPDGRTLAAAYWGGEIVFWDFDRESWVGRARAIANRELTPDESEQYLGRAHE